MKELDKKTLQDIEAYVNNQLGAKERLAFETLIATNKELATEVSKTELLKEMAIRFRTQEKVKKIQASKLKEWELEDEKSVKTYQKPLFTWGRVSTFSAAAAVLFFIYLSVTPIALPNTTTLSERGASTMDSSQAAVVQRYAEAHEALKNNKFELASQLFDEVSASDITPYNQQAAQWYSAVSLISKNPEQANKRLYNFYKIPNKVFKVSTSDKVRVWIKLKRAQLL